MIDIEKALPSLAQLRKQNLESDIITGIARKMDCDAETALRLYFQSKLSQQIEEGRYGIQNLDASYLLEDLFENEPELFST